MKKILFMLFFIGQSIFGQHVENDTIMNTQEIQQFQPDRKLLNAELWTRVSPNRFECRFLRLAVELRGYQYHLVEMDGNKRILISSSDYKVITNAILKLTLNETPNFSAIGME